MPLKVKTSISGIGTWKPVEQFLVKTSVSGFGIWKSIKSAFVKTDAGWKIFFGIAGPYTTKSPYFSTDTSGNTAVTGPTILYGSTIYGQRGTWVGNGGTISSYTYKLQGSTSSEVNTGTYTSILSETSMSGTYQQIIANTSQYDGKYLIFTVKATRSDGSTGSDSTDSNGTRFAVIRYAPVKKTFTDALLTTTSTSLPATLSYQSQWDGSTLYLPDSTRSSVKWYTASSNTYTAANIATYGTLVTSGITTGTPTNDGTTYTVTSTLITPSSVPSSTYYYAVDSQFNSNTDYYSTNSGIQQYAVYGPMAFPPTPIGQSPSITGSTTVGNLAYFNIGSWTNSPTSYAWRIYYNYNLVSAVLTYAGAKSVSNKTLSGYSATLTTSTSHGYKANDTVVISGMDSLFNGSYTINSKTNNTISFTLNAPTAYSAISSYTSGTFISYSGNAYRAVSTLPASSTFSITPAYSVGDNVSFGGIRYRCLITLSASSAWVSTSSYSTGQNVYYNSNRYVATSNISANSSAPGINPSWLSVMPNNTSYWENIDPGNASYWTIQSFSNTSISGTTTAPNYYEGTTTTADSFPLTIPTTDYKSGYDLRGQSLGIGVRAYNEIATSPSEYTAEKTVYGYPVITIGAITPSTTTASLAYTSSYMTSYTIDVKSSAIISSITGGTSTVTYYAPNTFVSGQVVTITGVNPSQYNITGTIATATSSYFTISTNITGSYVSGGTATASAPTYPKTSYSPSSPISITNLQELTTYTVSIYPTNAEGQNGVTKTSSFITYARPTISNISTVNTKAPSAATSPSFSSSSSNVGTLTWTNGANSSTAWLKSVTGAGTLSAQSDPGTLNTSGTFTINSSGTANATVSAINKNKSVYVTWAQTKAASYLISYKIGTAPSDVILGDSSASNPEILVYGPVTGTASQITINSVTVYNLAGQQGPSTLLNSGAVLTPTNAQTDTAFAGSVTYSSPPATPTITYSNVTSSGFDVSWSSTGATSYNVQIYQSISGNSVSGYPLNGTTNTSATVSGLSPNLGYSTTITAINSSGNTSNTASTTTLKNTALTPTFGSNTSTTGGFTGSVTNYDSNYTWSISTDSGSVAWGTITGNVRTFIVSGLSSGASATVTVTTTRTNYFDGSGTTTGTASANVAPSGGSISISLTSGTSGRVGAVYTATVTNASGTPTPTYTLQWKRAANYSPFTISNIGSGGSTYTSVYDDADSGIYCIATFTNAAGTQIATSNQLQVSPPTITGIGATTTNNTAPYVTWTAVGYNFQSTSGSVYYGATTPPTTLSGTAEQVNAGTTRSTSSRSGTAANYYRYDTIRAYSGTSGLGAKSGAITTTTVVRANAATTTTVYGTYP